MRLGTAWFFSVFAAYFVGSLLFFVLINATYLCKQVRC